MTDEEKAEVMASIEELVAKVDDDLHHLFDAAEEKYGENDYFLPVFNDVLFEFFANTSSMSANVADVMSDYIRKLSLTLAQEICERHHQDEEDEGCTCDEHLN